jgi:hydrogenase maturation protein HypF
MSVAARHVPGITRRHLRVRGVVQGVGFRPHVWRLARDEALDGWVRNDAEGVEIVLQGQATAIERFAVRLRAEAPPRARIDALETRDEHPGSMQEGFAILPSRDGAAHTMIGADTSVCAACLDEMLDPASRRWRYAFTNCTHCGPRYTITRAVPYDRARTSMAGFALCPTCAREYGDPADRRFHAEPIACPDCGPRLRWLDATGRDPRPDDPLAAAVAALRDGAIVAIKGLGGFHLACDARHAATVQRLRRRKQREAKPFALMLANLRSVGKLAHLDEASRALLCSPAHPIVLLPRKTDSGDALPGVADGMQYLGVMLPYTPLHVLLFHEYAGRPAGTDWIERFDSPALVMTSANPGGEPIVAGNDEAVARLGGIADALLVHDRDIVVRCDDSVVQCHHGRTRFVRRARGHAPDAIALGDSGPPVLALGAYMKNTVCATRDHEAFVSQHIGTLDNAATVESLAQTTDHLLRLLQVEPVLIAHDLHPDFASTRLAHTLAERLQVPTLAVQHHHAHIAAVAAEHRHAGPLLGLALDGIGLGEDGGAWGGELLHVDGTRFRRLGHLRHLALPGGDRAAREPWRMAAAALVAMGRGDAIAGRFPAQPAAPMLQRWLLGDATVPGTSSLGRWFDAAAALLGLCEVMDFEAQAAMHLEAAAAAHGPADAWPDGYAIDGGTLDLMPALRRLDDAHDTGEAAARFHATLARALADWTLRAARAERIDHVAVAGGCLLNTLLSDALCTRLRAGGLEVLEPRMLPPGDGAVSLGQAWIARLPSANRT